MIQLNLPEISQLNRFDARPDIPNYHPPTKRNGYKNKELPRIWGIYFIFNNIDELIYIGSSKNIQNRIAVHLGTSKGTSAITNKNEIAKVSYILQPYFKTNSGIDLSIDGIERIYIDFYKPKYNDIPIIKILPSPELQRWALKDVQMR